uniref:Uncharacterized protein n=1 Tax=Laurencia australis TaxID=3073067 RepID=A0AA51NEH9_9FLOR|nr:hypothetical protein [Laurencia australis]WMP11948.1 hypothetical protein [Laurencia australis]
MLEAYCCYLSVLTKFAGLFMYYFELTEIITLHSKLDN